MVPANGYASLVSASNEGQPLFTAWLTTLCEPMVTNSALLASLPAAFDVSQAVGQQLDYTGEWVGRDRFVNVAYTEYFSWDDADLGWDVGVWSSPYSPTTTRIALNDTQYRMVLAGGILNNQWDGSIPEAYRIWNSIYPPGSGPFLFLQDLSNMQMLIGLGSIVAPLDPITIALFNSGKITTKPVGVRVQFATTPVTPGSFFAFDTIMPGFAGWDEGQWASIT